MRPLSSIRADLNWWLRSYHFWRNRLGFANKGLIKQSKGSCLANCAHARRQVLDLMIECRIELDRRKAVRANQKQGLRLVA